MDGCVRMADRLHRRAQLRAARPGRVRAARLGDAAGGGRRPGRRPVRGRGAADPAAGEGPLHRRPGHRRPDPGLQRRAGSGDQAGQGRLPGPARTGLAARRRRRRRAWSGCSRSTAPSCPTRPASWSTVRRRRPDAEGAARSPADHLQPDVTDPAPVRLPGPGRGPSRRAGHRRHRAAARPAARSRRGSPRSSLTSTRTEGGCVSERGSLPGGRGRRAGPAPSR